MADLAALTLTEILERAARTRGDRDTDPDNHWPLVVELHRRGTRVVFDRAVAWCASSDRLLRGLGADVLGQLGFATAYPFAAESAPALMRLLDDSDEGVVSDGLIALGHLGVGSDEDIGTLASHPSADVRYAVAWCFSNRTTAPALAALITLSRDPDAKVRDWATFGLGSLSGVDSEAISTALLERLDDPDAETRGEAMVGLAIRGDRRAEAAILAALREPAVNDLVLEAARELGLSA